jgi:hypothetical protein
MVCCDCRSPFELSVGEQCRHRELGTVPRCHACRHPQQIVVTLAIRRFLTESAHVDEIREIGP